MAENDIGQVLRALWPENLVALPDARRADPQRLLRDIDAVSRSPVVEALLAATNTSLLVVNEQRQIVASNGRGLGSGRPAGSLGMRLGETFGCVNALAAGDCGVAPACAGCGALGATVGCLAQGKPADRDCLLRIAGGGALEFDVRATPVAIGDGHFVVVSLRDITGEKRREALEQVFFHDVLNTVTGLRGWSELLRLSNGSHPGAPERIERLARQLEREIRDHRALMLAEDGKLIPRPERVSAADMLREVESVFASHVVARGRRLDLEFPADLELETDPALLRRVLVNMTRNAFEATEPGGAVRLRCERIAAMTSTAGVGSLEDRVRFSVHNEGIIPPEVQAHIFQRSFSTKAQHGRGFGTYSMKLLGESYLRGKVSFVSDLESGTVFYLELPPALLAQMPVVSC